MSTSRVTIESLVLDQFPQRPFLFLSALVDPTVVHLLAHVLLHRLQPQLENLHRRGHKGVAVDAELLELAEAADGVRKGGDLVVADVELDEGEKEPDGVRQGFQVLEVLANVEDLEVDQVLEALREGPEAVEAGVEDAEGGQVAEGMWEEYELVRIYREFSEVVQLESDCVRQFAQLVEVGVQFFQ